MHLYSKTCKQIIICELVYIIYVSSISSYYMKHRCIRFSNLTFINDIHMCKLHSET